MHTHTPSLTKILWWRCHILFTGVLLLNIPFSAQFWPSPFLIKPFLEDIFHDHTSPLHSFLGSASLQHTGWTLQLPHGFSKVLKYLSCGSLASTGSWRLQWSGYQVLMLAQSCCVWMNFLGPGKRCVLIVEIEASECKGELSLTRGCPEATARGLAISAFTKKLRYFVDEF